jgi:hypothetical protein
VNKEEIKRRLNRRIDEDDNYAKQVQKALETQNDYLLALLINEVVDFVIEVGTAIWDWIRRQFG